MPRPSHSSRFDHPKIIGWGVQIIKLLIMQLFPLRSHLAPLRSKYSLQHPIFKHPQPTFLPQCEQPSFTPIQNNRQNYSSVYLTFVFLGSNLINGSPGIPECISAKCANKLSVLRTKKFFAFTSAPMRASHLENVSAVLNADYQQT